MVSGHQKLGARRGNGVLQESGETDFAHTLLLDFWPSELGQNKFLLF